ncbi:MAG: LysM peptidoglycan-binding domain-containing protein [Terricaulis sp.]
MTLHNDYATNGTSVVYSDSRTLNAKGQVTSESVSTVRGSTTYLAASSYTYGAGASYALGSPLTITTVNYENGVQKKTNLTSNSYLWSDGPLQLQIDYTPDTSVPGTVNHTTYYYDTIGGQNQLGEIGINDGRPRTVQFRNDFMGQGIRRDEADNITTAGDPHELWYRFSGREMIYVGNNGSVDTDEATSITNRTASQGTGAFFNGASSGTSFADSDLAYDSIDSYDQGSTGGMYTVRDGDTLASIASSLWGDSSLWYKIAELNGLTADSALPTGMPLLIPVGVIRSTNNATTYKPYDPAEIVGNTMPTAVKPPKSKHNCGVLGQIVLVVIAAVVAFYTAGAAAQFFAGAMNLNAAAITAAGEIATGTAAAGTVTGASLATLGAAAGGAAVGGAVGSVVSQAVGVATGIQDKFSWNAVGLAAIGAAIGVGTGKYIKGTSNFAAAERGMLNSAITQGIGVATGMQSKFSWAAVAAAGIGSAAGNEFRHDFGDSITGALSGHAAANTAAYQSAQFAISGIVAMVDAIAGAATRTLIEGTDFGDNVLAALPDAIGSTIGNALAQGLTSQITAAEERHRAQEAAASIAARVAEIEATTLPPPTTGAVPSDSRIQFQDKDVILQPGQSITRPSLDIGYDDEGNMIRVGSDTEHVYTNTGTTEIDIIPGAQINEDGGITYVMQNRNDGASYSARVAGEVGIYDFSQLHLQITDQLKPGIAEIRWLSQAWREASPAAQRMIMAGSQLPGAFEGLILNVVSPRAAQGMADMLEPLVNAGASAFNEINAENVANGYYSPRTQAQINEMAPVVLAVAGAVLAMISGRRAGPRELRMPGVVNLERLGELRALAPRASPGELAAAVELQGRLGGRLTGGATSELDFVFTSGPYRGKTVDFMLTPSTTAEEGRINQHFEQNADIFESQLTRHLGKADLVPIDTRFLTPANRGLLDGMIGRLHPEEQRRVILMR